MPDLPSPPFVEVPGVANFRDIGGRRTADGKTVKHGLVYRAADPTKATDQGLSIMEKQLDIKTIFDLRSAPEIKRDGPEWAGVAVDNPDAFDAYGIRRDWVPVFAEQDYGPEQVALRYKEYKRGGVGFVNAYRDILTAGAGSNGAYTKIFKQMAREGFQPCLVHCTAGKDRTGVFVALLFMLVGVPKEVIAQEYSLTEVGLADLRPLFVERLLKNPALEGDREGVMNMVGSSKENMEASVDMIVQEFGGAEEYMKEKCELSDAEVEQIKKNLLEQ